MIDESHFFLGSSIPAILRTYGDSLPKAIKDNKKYRGVESFVVFFEFFGPNSFAGWHDPEVKEREVVVFDISLYKKGFIPPRDFLNDIGHLKIPKVIYEGNFNKQFIEDVKEGKYPVFEGIVAKGINENKKSNPIWMCKVKTKQWLEELKNRMAQSEEFRKSWNDNIKEQYDG